MAESRIIYALIAKGTRPLVGYSNYTGTFDQFCIGYLKNIGPGASAAIKSDEYVIFYINQDNITYLLMCDHTYPKEAAIGCLKSIQKEFSTTYPNNDFNDENNFCLNKEFQTKLRMKFDYFNANKDVTNDAIGHLKEELNKMKDVVLNASGLLDERGGKIKVLDEKSDSLSRDSNTFYRQSKKVRRAELMKKIKIYLAIGCVGILILYIIIAIACSPTFKC